MDEQQVQLNLIATAMNEMQATVNEVASNTEADAGNEGRDDIFKRFAFNSYGTRPLG